ncbi:hypothetical protein BC833DRAFT_619552 [Globomyces pollinis-pini]|nr:hypothetical protein BC833DRAFT_619552 [Globomyces pollinis-pini]KAJ2998852.1 hypothetical protein HDV02_003962 [Globomyces sp. JEL0801]
MNNNVDTENAWQEEKLALPKLPEKDDYDQLVSEALTLQEQLLNAIMKVDKAKAAYMKLKSQNQTLVEYMNNLVAATENK